MKEHNKIILKNTIAQYIRIIISAVLAILSSRYVLHSLGVEDYGLFSVVAGFVTLFGFLNNSLLVSVQRFISYEIPAQNIDSINKIYSASIFIHIILAIIVLLFSETLGAYFLKTKMQFPDGQLNSAILVFHCVVISFVFNIISIPQQAVLVAFEKIYIFSLVGIIEAVLKFVCALSLQYYSGNRLVFYSITFLSISVIIRLLYALIIKRNYKFLKNTIIPEKGYVKRLFSFAGWNTFGAIANLGKIQGVNVLLNMFFGTAINAAYGLANQLNSQFVFFQSSIFQSSNSQIVQSYRLGDTKRLSNLVDQTSKYAFIIFATVTLSVWVCTDDLLYLWLNDVPGYCNVFVRLMILNSCIELFSTPLMYIVQASGNIKSYFILISIIMLLILPISYLALRLGAEPSVVLFVTIFINSILLAIRLNYIHCKVGYNTFGYIRKVILPSALVMTISLISLPYLYSLFDNVIYKVLISLFISPITIITLSIFIIFTKNDRLQISLYVKKIIAKIIRN